MQILILLLFLRVEYVNTPKITRYFSWIVLEVWVYIFRDIIILESFTVYDNILLIKIMINNKY